MDRKVLTWSLASANLLSAIAGGWILSKSLSKLNAVHLLEHFGSLMALILGSLMAIFALWLTQKKSFSFTTGLMSLGTIAASTVLLLLDVSLNVYEPIIAWFYFIVLSVRWMFWASARTSRGALAATFGGNPFMEMFAFIGLALGAFLPNFVSMTITVVLIIDILLQLLAFCIDQVACKRSKVESSQPKQPSTAVFIDVFTVPVPVLTLMAFGAVCLATLAWDTALAPVGVVASTLLVMLVVGPLFNNIAAKGGLIMVKRCYSYMFVGAVVCLTSLSLTLGSLPTEVQDGVVQPTNLTKAVLTISAFALLLIGGSVLLSTHKTPPVSFPFWRAAICTVALVAATQMVLFAAKGTLPDGLLKRNLVTMVYVGGVIASLCCMFGNAVLRVPAFGDASTSLFPVIAFRKKN